MGITVLRLLTWLLTVGILAPPVVITATAAGYEQHRWIAAAIMAGVVWPGIMFVTPSHLSGDNGRGKLLLIAYLVLGVLAAVMTAGTSSFMLDVDDKRFALGGKDDFETKHNCFTCLPVGAHLAREGKVNIYEQNRYRRASEADKTPVHREIGEKVTIDSLPYPPPALLIVQVLNSTGHGFYQLRTYWYALSVLALLAALLCGISCAGGFRGNTSLLLFPLVLLAPNVIGTLQIGNIHLLVIAFIVLARVAFAKEWYGIGGLLLGYAILTKLWPAALLAYLLFGRQWRAVGSTLISMVLLTLAALAAFGSQSLQDFFAYQLPRLLSGQAFAFMTALEPMSENISIFGWPPKLHLLGYGEAHSLLPGTLKWSYTGFLVLVIALAGLRLGRREADYPLTAIRVWLGLTVLVQLRSPFLPGGYGVVPVLCLLLFLLPGSGIFRGILVMAGFLVAAVGIDFLVTPVESDTTKIWYSLTISSIAFLSGLTAVLPVLFGKTAKGDDLQDEDTPTEPADILDLQPVEP